MLDWYKTFVGDLSYVVHTALIGITVYIGVVAIIRLSGKLTLAKMTAYDFIVTVALGSTLASSLTSKTTSAVQALTGVVILVGMQLLGRWLSRQSNRAHALINASPSLVLLNGEPLQEQMIHLRVSKSQILAAVRTANLGSLDQVSAVVLETDGSFTVIPKSRAGDLGALEGVSRSK